MKNIFPGHFKHSDEKLADIWKESLFVFDTNILFNLYRYSEATRKDFLALMEQVKDRSFLPHQAAVEYLNGRTQEIERQKENYSESIKQAEAFTQGLEATTKHPFVAPEIMSKFEAVFKELMADLEANKNSHRARLDNDDIKDSISTLFDGKTGGAYGNTELEKIIVDGAERYEQKRPPGYMDANKDVPKGCKAINIKARPYGDLIIWKQLLNKAKSDETSVIFITDDSKEDWWEITKKGKITIGPRPELIKELIDEVGKDFHMYSARRFLDLAGKYLGNNASDETLKEVQEVSQREASMVDKFSVPSYAEQVFNQVSSYSQNEAQLRHDLLEIGAQIKNVRGEIKELVSEIDLDTKVYKDTMRTLNKMDNSEGFSSREIDDYRLKAKNLKECVITARSTRTQMRKLLDALEFQEQTIKNHIESLYFTQLESEDEAINHYSPSM